MSKHAEKNLILYAWTHSCPQHGQHIVLYGTDCATTARHNASRIHAFCEDAVDSISPMTEHIIDTARLSAFLEPTPQDRSEGANEPQK